MGIPVSPLPDLSNLTPTELYHRKREWNRGPLLDLFPRLPPSALEPLLDTIIAKSFTYNLSDSKFNNSRRYTSMVVAHVRHHYTNYDALWRDEGIEKWEARRRTAGEVWKVLREWCPWDESNEVLERCWKATLVSPEERDGNWDPMDVDDEDEVFGKDGGGGSGVVGEVEVEAGDPMDLD
ncbi:unnamed protein product [Zymoseptoria tritici ST99CH_3D7]|uniref:DUF2293 domain-containing protein n=1 Tax=Zymoseptoria tritici (strain ST99CH_3D7) TaxID=1276538 RepID=A0A1X7RGY3_ZYMT9|nr:unnamed protein product [Zymoseptoria tritici ST99CH_3D7]